jgi:hypothetical protein
MHPVVRALGKILRLVGISSPEDAEAKRETAGGPPSWRNAAPKPKKKEKEEQGE